MGRKDLPTTQNPTMFKILVGLSTHENTSYGLSKKLNMSQSYIYTRMQQLVQDKYLTNAGNGRATTDPVRICQAFIDYVTVKLQIDEETKSPDISHQNYYLQEALMAGFQAIEDYIMELDLSHTLESFFQNIINSLVDISMTLQRSKDHLSFERDKKKDYETFVSFIDQLDILQSIFDDVRNDVYYETLGKLGIFQ